MLSLAFDTATRQGRFALAEGDDLLAYRPLNVAGSYADALLPVIEEMLVDTDRRLGDVKAIGVTTGPGSFTGVRIGVATAKGLAWGLGCRLVGVSSLEAMAAAMLVEEPSAELAVPALDARRGEIFCGLYRRQGSWVAPLLVPAARTPDRWWADLVAALADPEAPVYAGDGAGLLLGHGSALRPELAGAVEPTLRRWSVAHPATASALAVALGGAAFPTVHPFSLVPDYMRVSDAESKRRLDLTPDRPAGDFTSHESRRPGHD